MMGTRPPDASTALPDHAAGGAPPLIIGHRGAAGLVPENTLPSFLTALRLGADGVELDVQLAHERLWVLHDAALDRTTNLKGPLPDQPLERLLSADAGNGAALPQLHQVLDALQAACLVNIELKGPGTAAPVATMLAETAVAQTILVSSFKEAELERYRAVEGPGRLGLLLDRWRPDTVARAEMLQAWSVHLALRVVTPARVRTLREAGYRVFVYTVNQLRSARRLTRLGVDGLFTDRPDRINRVALADAVPAADRSAGP